MAYENNKIYNAIITSIGIIEPRFPQYQTDGFELEFGLDIYGDDKKTKLGNEKAYLEFSSRPSARDKTMNSCKANLEILKQLGISEDMSKIEGEKNLVCRVKINTLDKMGQPRAQLNIYFSTAREYTHIAGAVAAKRIADILASSASPVASATPFGDTTAQTASATTAGNLNPFGL